jgi:hypothetical protein
VPLAGGRREQGKRRTDEQVTSVMASFVAPEAPLDSAHQMNTEGMWRTRGSGVDQQRAGIILVLNY